MCYLGTLEDLTYYEVNLCKSIIEFVLLLGKEISTCSDKDTRKAFDLISNKTSNCTRAPTCKMTRFTSSVKEKKSYVENTDVVWLAFSNPEVANYNT